MSSMSGIETADDVKPTFEDMKQRHKYKWMTFKIQDKKKIVVDETCEHGKKTTTKEEDKARFEELKAKFTKEPVYAVYDFGFTNKEGRQIEKLAFIFWSPDDGKIGDKMIYASSKEKLKSLLSDPMSFQANDASDTDYDTLVQEVEKKA